jgi:hypothetical protein
MRRIIWREAKHASAVGVTERVKLSSTQPTAASTVEPDAECRVFSSATKRSGLSAIEVAYVNPAIGTKSR